MGYSIFAVCDNKNDQKKMLSFLEKNMKNNINDIIDDEHGENYITDDVSYNGQLEDFPLIGFDYNCGGYERFYIYSICYWIAIRLNIKKLFNKEQYNSSENATFITCEYKDDNTEYHYIVYDGYQYIPFKVDTSEKVDDEDAPTVDENGMRIITEHNIKHFLLFDFKNSTKIKKLNKIHEELKRLTKVWNEENESKN